jgi:hypothetical protein
MIDIIVVLNGIYAESEPTSPINFDHGFQDIATYYTIKCVILDPVCWEATQYRLAYLQGLDPFIFQTKDKISVVIQI